MLEDIQQKTGTNEVPFSLIQKLSKTPIAKVAKFLAQYIN